MTSILNNNILLLESSQEFKEILINNSTRVLAIFARGVLDKNLTSPPVSPNVDDYYIVGTGATGAWTGQDNKIAVPAINSNNTVIAGSWDFISPINGLKVFIIDEANDYYFNGTNWITISLSSGVSSINGEAGTVVLDADDIDDISTTNKFATQAQLDAILANAINIGNKQDTLISGTSIKTINTESILGSGDITISGGGGSGGLTYSSQSTSFNATNNNSYGVNTTNGAITATLPASPSDGDVVAFSDAASTFGTSNLTIDGNGNNIAGYSTISLTGHNENVQLRYSTDANQWMIEEAAYQGG